MQLDRHCSAAPLCCSAQKTTQFKPGIFPTLQNIFSLAVSFFGAVLGGTGKGREGCLAAMEGVVLGSWPKMQKEMMLISHAW